MRKPLLQIGFLPLLAVVSPNGACVPSVVQPGGWNMDIDISTPIARTGEIKPVNSFQGNFCLTREAMEKDPYLTPGVDGSKLIQKEEKCVVSDENMTADSSSWKKTCTTADGAKTELLVHTVASAREITSDVEKTVTKRDRPFTIKMTVHSTYSGDCNNDMNKL